MARKKHEKGFYAVKLENLFVCPSGLSEAASVARTALKRGN